MQQKKIFQFVILSIIVVAFLYIVYSINISEIISSLEKVNVRLIILSMALVFLSFSLSGYRWQIITKEIEAEQSSKFYNCLGFCAVGFLMGLVITSRLGYYGKAPLVAKYDSIPLSKGISAVNIETLQDLFFLIMATGISLFILMGYQSTTILSNGFLLGPIIAVIIIFSYLFFHPEILLKFCVSFQGALSRTNDSSRIIKCVKSIFLKIVQLIEDTHDLLLKKQLMGELFLVTLIYQIIAVVGFYSLILSFGTTISFVYLFAIYFISSVIGIISMIPGGFGSLDLSLIFFLQEGGLNLSESLNVVILWRFCIILPILLIGLSFFVINYYKPPNNNQPRSLEDH